MDMDFVLEEVKRVTNDNKPETIRFVQKAVRILGPDLVLGQLKDVSYGLRLGNIKEPGPYFSKLLKEQLDLRKVPSKSKTPPHPIATYFDKDQQSLFSKFKRVEIPDNEKAERKIMEIPYSDKHIPWITTLGAEFFTLSNNKSRSDEVELVLRSMDGEKLAIKMIRGRIEPGADEFGILNVQHGKLFATLKNEWVRKGCAYMEYKNKAVVCILSISARDLAESLGWKSFGGVNLKMLTNLLYALKVRPYYLDFRSVDFENRTGYGFTLLSDVTVMTRKTQGGNEKMYEIMFSPFVSLQLLGRHVVGKAKDLVYVKSELAFLIKLHIESRVVSLNGQVYSKSLTSLIQDLSLPEASWHKYPAMRKREFEKAIKQIDGTKISDGKILKVRIEKGTSDYLLVSTMVRQPKLLT